MAFSRVEAYAPATVANLGVGFDILGMALEGLGDRAVVEFHDSPEILISDIQGDGGKLPRDPAQNVATVAAKALLDELDERRGVKFQLFKGLPLSSGLGSSAASAVVAVLALNKLLGEPFSRRDLLPFCLEGEALVSGYHADNVAPSLLGGMVLVAGITVGSIRILPIPAALRLALVTPHVQVPTNGARAILPAQIPLATLVHQSGAVAQLVDALHRDDLAALGAAMEKDQVVEPVRAYLMPMLEEVRAAAKRAGAIAVFIGGAGPTLCALCDSQSSAKAAALAMQAVYDEIGMGCAARSSAVDRQGAILLSAS